MNDIESRLLCELMIDSEAYDSFYEIAGELDEKMFSDMKNRNIYRAIKDLRKKGDEVDEISVSGLLQIQNKLEDVGGRHRLAVISSLSISSAAIQTTTRQVLELYFKRHLLQTGQLLASQAQNGVDVFELAEKSIGAIQKVLERGQGDKTRKIGDVITEIRSNYSVRKTSGGMVEGMVHSGIKTLDALLSGFKPTDLIVIGARPSTGKSNVGFNLMVNASEFCPVGFVSAEMDTIAVVQRSLSTVGEFDDSALTNGSMTVEQEDRFQFACDLLKDRKVYINDKAAVTIAEVEVLARKWKREKGIGILIVDYIQLLRAPQKGRNREGEISEISHGLKKIAKELKIPVVALAQLNRDVEKRRQLPILSDLRESGSIEQDADVIILLHSFESIGEHTIPNNFQYFGGQSSKDVVLFLIRKNRRGRRDVYTFVHFDKSSGK